MLKRLTVLTMFGFVLMGCSQSTHSDMNVDESLFHTYQCESEQYFDVAYIPDSDIAILRVVDKEYALIRIRSGSGARYILNDGTADVENPITLRTKADDARLEYHQQVYKNCKTQ
ncbi:MliC family protein [Vibrio amylolyticus]|uniref:MliC family protein n=1 Tax=Vibrio amylolyticus TaxID=2847292 RepID=UPI00354D1819